MLYLIHFAFKGHELKLGQINGGFSYLVEAVSAEEAVEKCHHHLVQLKEKGDFFLPGKIEIYLRHAMAVKKVPPEPFMINFEKKVGEEQGSLSFPAPPESKDVDIFEWSPSEEEPGEEEAESPFIVFE